MAKKELLELTNHEHIASANGENINARRIGLYGYDYGNSQWRRVAVDANGSIVSNKASASEPFVTIGNTTGLSAERALTGTTNQITVTDNGANSTVILSTPQDIHTGASPTFANLILSARTATRIAYFGTGGAFADNANFTFDGSQLALATLGTSGGVLIGTDFQIYRRAANTGATASGDSFEVASNLAVGTTINTDIAGYFSKSISTNVSARAVNAELTITGAISANFPIGIRGRVDVSAGANAVSYVSGIIASVRDAATQSGLITNQFGLDFDVWKSGSANVTLLAAGRGFVTIRPNSSGTTAKAVVYQGNFDTQSGTFGTVTDAIMFEAFPTHAGTGTITRMTGLLISSGIMTGTAPGTLYGIRINDLSGGTTNYGIYFDGTSGLARQGIWWNADTNLYRAAADRLRSDDTIEGLQIRATGDSAGLAATTTLTNATDSIGDNIVDVLQRRGDIASTHQGWIKVYVGTAARYIPFWD